VSDICAVVPVQDSVVVTLPVYEPLEIEVSDDLQIPCLGFAPIAVTNAVGGNGVYTYQWTLSGAPVGNAATINVPNGDDVYYVVTVEEGCGQVAQDSVLVGTVPLDPVVVTTSDDTLVICAGDTAAVSIAGITGGNGVFTRVWSGPDGVVVGVGNVLRVPVNENTTYTITVTDQCGNTGSATVNTLVPTYAPLQVELPDEILLCLGDSSRLQAVVSGGSGFFTLFWGDEVHNDPVRWVMPEVETIYTLNVLDRCGEVANAETRVAVEEVYIDIVSTSEGQDDWLLQAVSLPAARTYLWDMRDGTRYRTEVVRHSFSVTDDHWVTLSVITANGCTALDSTLLIPPAQFHFPNAFTPDGDGINDLFMPVGAEITEFSMLVFDRWGRQLFTSTEALRSWDGTVNGGDPASTGVYIYKYRVAGLHLPPQEGIGHVTLLRGTTTAP
jgi:gliding motility-associated-like protein